jgi:hypothetical protein
VIIPPVSSGARPPEPPRGDSLTPQWPRVRPSLTRALRRLLRAVGAVSGSAIHLQRSKHVEESPGGRRSLAVVACNVLAWRGGGAVAGSLTPARTSRTDHHQCRPAQELGQDPRKVQGNGTLKIQDPEQKAQDALKKVRGPAGPSGPPVPRVPKSPSGASTSTPGDTTWNGAWNGTRHAPRWLGLDGDGDQRRFPSCRRRRDAPHGHRVPPASTNSRGLNGAALVIAEGTWPTNGLVRSRTTPRRCQARGHQGLLLGQDREGTPQKPPGPFSPNTQYQT